MTSYHPPETFLTIAGIELRTYGLILGVAIVIAFLWSAKRALKAGIPKIPTENILFWTVVGGLLGARIAFVLQNTGFYFENPLEILAIRSGGLSFHGALVGGLVAGYFALKNYRLLSKFWLLADAVSAPLLLAAAIGRLGNWANQELYGYQTDRPWGIFIDSLHRLPGYEQFSSFHPTFAYEAVLNIVGVTVLLFIEGKRQKAKGKISSQNSKPLTTHYSLLTQPGTMFLFALAWYSLARGITEIWRIGDRVVGPLSLAQIVSILTIILLAWIGTRRRLHGTRSTS